MKGIIISGGEISENEPLKEYITDDCIVVCADSGYISALKHNVKPDVLLGDFDSIGEMGYSVPEDDIKTIRYKVEKDQTDTQLCIDYLVEQGVFDVLVFGALGGKRFDHTFANLQLLEYGLSKGVHITIKDKNTNIFAISDGDCEICGKAGDKVSVFALHLAQNITYKGLKYPLINGEITSVVPYGVSNEMTGNTAEISVGRGTVLIIHTGGENFEKR